MGLSVNHHSEAAFIHSDLKSFHSDLQIGSKYLANYKLSYCEQPPLSELEIVEIDFEGKPFVLVCQAAEAWRRMRAAAKRDQVFFEPFSGFRSYLYQKQMITRRLAQGRSLDDILSQVAIPGFSEHHSGRAVDICTDQIFDLTESFEKSAAFFWLSKNAAAFGFQLSYPRGNQRGIIYEPWHWCFNAPLPIAP
jgi:zinc D-Ala-D-Ala carboxypeptidase